MKRLLLSLFFILPFSPLYAWDFNIALGHTGQSETVFRFGLSQPWESQWFESGFGHLTGFWDVGFTSWEKGKHDKSTYSISFSPVLLYKFNSSSTITPFLEAGIGLALFNHTKAGSKQLGSHLLFEDRLGIGAEINRRHVIGFRVKHYSNLGFKKPNEGIENYNLYYRYQF